MSLKANAIKEKKGKKIMVLIYSHTFTLKWNCGNIGIVWLRWGRNLTYGIHAKMNLKR